MGLFHQHQKAIRHFSEALRIKPDYAEAHNSMGIALARNEDFQKAITHFREAIKLKPDFHQSRMYLKNAIEDLERIEKVKKSNHSLP